MSDKKIYYELKKDLEEILSLMKEHQPGDFVWLQIELNIIQKKIKDYYLS